MDETLSNFLGGKNTVFNRTLTTQFCFGSRETVYWYLVKSTIKR
ncbi:hypothetical protein OUQ91_001562 [Loigolactobacillus backii]|nr:hypothetical protein [Loigolactobacillus backii]